MAKISPRTAKFSTRQGGRRDGGCEGLERRIERFIEIAASPGEKVSTMAVWRRERYSVGTFPHFVPFCSRYGRLESRWVGNSHRFLGMSEHGHL